MHKTGSNSAQGQMKPYEPDFFSPVCLTDVDESRCRVPQEQTHTHHIYSHWACSHTLPGVHVQTRAQTFMYAACTLQWDHLCSKSNPPLSTLLFFALQYFLSSLTLHSLFAYFPFHPSYSAASPPHPHPPTSSLFPCLSFSPSIAPTRSR